MYFPLRDSYILRILKFAIVIYSAFGVEPDATYIGVGEACAKGYFPCGENFTHCLAQRHWCDGQADCSDGQDESLEKCEAHGGFKGNFLEKHTGMMTTVDPFSCVLTRVPEECTCMHQSRLWCDNMGLEALPANVPATSTHLYLQYNHIKLGPFMFENLTALQHLNLIQNNITHIPSEAFKGLFHLQKLLVQENQIARLDEGIFEDNTELMWLFLQDNAIEFISPGVFTSLQKLTWLNLNRNRLHFQETDVMPLNAFIEYLELEDNSIDTVGQQLFREAENIRVIFLAKNGMNRIHKKSLHNLTQLIEICFAENRLKSIPKELFRQNIYLENVNLSGNPLSSLDHTLFKGLEQLNLIDLSGLTIKNINTAMFSSLSKLEHIYFSTFQYCRYVPFVRHCEPHGDGISSVNNLLEPWLLRVAIWLVAVVCLLGNAAVFCMRCLIRTDNRVHSFVIWNLCASDFLMGIYLAVMAVNDARYRNVYNRHALAWMESWRCVGAGLLAVISAQVSICIVLFMSLERFATVTFPYKCWRLGQKGVAIILALIWFIGVTVAVVPLTWKASLGSFYSTNGVCLPLHVHDPYMDGWQYSAAVFLGFNSICLVLVAYCYAAMFIAILRTGRTVHRQIYEDMVLAKRFVLIVFTDACCWLPIIIIKILAFTDYPISNSCYAWVTVFVLPLNSALNPVVYSLSTPLITRKLKHLLCTEHDKSEASTRHNSSFLASGNFIGATLLDMEMLRVEIQANLQKVRDVRTEQLALSNLSEQKQGQDA